MKTCPLCGNEVVQVNDHIYHNKCVRERLAKLEEAAKPFDVFMTLDGDADLKKTVEVVVSIADLRRLRYALAPIEWPVEKPHDPRNDHPLEWQYR